MLNSFNSIKNLDVIKADFSKTTPLHELFNSEVFIAKDINDQKILLNYFIAEKNADINARNKNGFTPLHFACKNKNIIAIDYLIERNSEFHDIKFDVN